MTGMTAFLMFIAMFLIITDISLGIEIISDYVCSLLYEKEQRERMLTNSKNVDLFVLKKYEIEKRKKHDKGN